MNPGRNIDPAEVLASLKEGASVRKQKSLDIVNDICKEQHERGSKDLSIAMIGRLSAERGGPSAQPIRNKTGADYRALIEAWASYADSTSRKLTNKSATASKDADLLNAIPDQVVRAVVGSRLRELSKLRGEVALLKAAVAETLVIDMRLKKASNASTETIQVVTPIDMLVQAEVDALRHALSPEFLNKMGWRVEQTGKVIAQDGSTILFKPGFATALKKIIDASAK